MTAENKNKKVVIFGGAGFLGSHIADVLTERGYQVVIFDIKESSYLKEGQVSVVGDITDQNAVEEAMKIPETWRPAPIELDALEMKPPNRVERFLTNKVLDALRAPEI